MEVDATIDGLVNQYVFPMLREPALHIINAGGKRLRPTIAILTAGAFGCDPHFVLPPASSIEVMHTASLIHDDVIDNCSIRRGVPCVHIKWDTTTAVLAGDVLLSVAVKALVIPLAKSNVGGIALSYVSDDFIENMHLFSEFWGQICEGKKMDVMTDFGEINESKVFELMYKKTAVLFELAGKLGAGYAGATKEESSQMGEFGTNLGMAFQIQDDILGLLGDEKVLGKNVGIDIKNGKKTLLVSHFLQNASQSDRANLEKIFGDRKAPDELVVEITDAIRSSGAIDYAKNHANNFIRTAKEKLDVLPDCDEKQYLTELSDFVISRVK